MQIFRPQTVKDALNAVAVAQAGDVVHMPVAPMGHFKPGRIAAGVILQAGTYSRIECSSDGVIFDRPAVKSMGQGFDTFGIIITGNDCAIKFPIIDNRDGAVWTVRDWLNKACGGIMLRGHRNKVTGGNLYNVRHGLVPHDQGSASIIEGVHLDGIAGDAFRLNQDGMVLDLCIAKNFKAVDGNHDDGGQNNVVIDINPVFRGDQMQIAVQRNNGNVVFGNQAARINPFWPGNQEIPPAEALQRPGKLRLPPARLRSGSGPGSPGSGPGSPPVVVPETPVDEPQEPLPPTDEPQAAIIAEIEVGLANLTALVAKLKR
jgi:hypothetical protein